MHDHRRGSTANTRPNTYLERNKRQHYAEKRRVAVDVDIHGYIHVWISDIGCPMDISMDILDYV